MFGGLKSIFEEITLFKPLINYILNLDTLILDGLKQIFIPDTQQIKVSFQNFVDELTVKLGFTTDFFGSIFSNESPIEDVSGSYYVPNVGEFGFTFFDADFLNQAIKTFRPIIRGFIVFLMALYNIKMILSFIRQDAGVVTSKGADITK